ncbi:hypothetical protein LINPERHAP2_LOCUS28619 [Linum perenne]
MVIKHPYIIQNTSKFKKIHGKETKKPTIQKLVPNTHSSKKHTYLLRFFQSLTNRLWDYDGLVNVSELTQGTFLIEFPTVSVCDWVLEQLWHVHLPLFLKKWSLKVEPITLAPSGIPVWVLVGVPVPLCTHLGIGHLSSLVGKPISKLVRNGQKVKVCVLRSPEVEKPSVLKVTVASVTHIVEVVYSESRIYEDCTKGVSKESKTKSVWQQKVVVANSAIGNVVVPSLEGEASPRAELEAATKQVPGNGSKSSLGEEDSLGTSSGGGSQLPSPTSSSKIPMENAAQDTSDSS